MRIRWYGQSAFLLSGEKTVMIDPFGPLGEQAAARGHRLRVPGDRARRRRPAADHARARATTAPPSSPTGSPTVDPLDGGHLRFARRRGGRRRVGARRRRRHDPRPEHDLPLLARRSARLPPRRPRPAGAPPRTGRGDRRGRRPLRPRRAAARRWAASAAAEVVRALRPRLVVPMHYRTPAIGFLDPPDAFLDALGAPVERLDEPEFDPAHHLGSSGRPSVIMPAAPLG